MVLQRVASVEEIPVGEGREFVVDGKIIAVFHTETGFYALDGICPHAGGPLAKGRLHQQIVTCPWHGWQFDVSTGRHCLTSQIRQPCYVVTIDGSDVWISLPEQPQPN